MLKIGIEEVRRVLNQIPQQMREILEYKYLLELSDEEIAKTLGIKKSSVRQYVSRARKATYALLEEKEHE